MVSLLLLLQNPFLSRRIYDFWSMWISHFFLFSATSMKTISLIALLLTTHMAAADWFSSLGGSGVACLASHLQCSRSLSERDDYYRQVRCFTSHLNKCHKGIHSFYMAGQGNGLPRQVRIQGGRVLCAAVNLYLNLHAQTLILNMHPYSFCSLTMNSGF
jgi:hypothetical protein